MSSLPRRRFPARRVTAAAALGVVAALACAGPASAAGTGPAAAAGWLSGALTDGDHVVIGGFAYDGTSADTVYALIAAGGHDDTVAAVDSYLQANVASYADPAGTGSFPGPYSGGLAKLSLVAESTGQDPHAYGGFDLLEVLVDNECTAPFPTSAVSKTRKRAADPPPTPRYRRPFSATCCDVGWHPPDEVRVEVDVADRHVTIVECRPPWREDFGPDWTRFPIARLRYVKTAGLWSLFWRDRHLKFHTYDRVPASANIEELLAEVDRDPTAIFWG